VLNFQTLEFEVGNELPYVLHLPTYTATAWYHSGCDADLQGDLQQALGRGERTLPAGPYAHALFQGSALTPAAHADHRAQGGANYTG
jgi:hypothetical protein